MLSEDAYRALQAEFQDQGNDGLDRMEAAIDGTLRQGGSVTDALAQIRRETHTLKGLGGSFGFPLITAITHRLEDYLSEESELSAPLAKEIDTFLDSIRKILRDGTEPQGEAAAALLRSLPTRRALSDMTVDPVDVEVLIGIPASVTARIVRTVLHNCGFRAVRATSFLDTFMTAVRSMPDAVIVSQTLDELSGTELARALSAITLNRGIPIGILTSFDPSNAAFRDLPPEIAIIRSGKPHFDDDMADFLTRVDVKKA